MRTLRKTRKAARTQRSSVEAAQTMSHLQAGGEADVDHASTVVAVEFPGTNEHEPSSQSQSGEADISSSQSSSIDPHTPSVNGDLVSHTNDTLVVNHGFSGDINGTTTEADVGFPIEALASASNADYRTHWSRLMTRLNHSEESSPRGTPKASTPAPPIVPNITPPQSYALNGSLPPQARTRNGDALVGRSSPELFDVRSPHRVLRRHPNVSRPWSMSSLSRGSESLGVPTSCPSVSHLPPSLLPDQVPSPPDMIVKRTRQLQLLDSVVAEESTRRTSRPTPPSARILEAYPQPSGLVPAQVSPVRSTSVSPEGFRTLSIPFDQHKRSVPSLSGVSSSTASAALQHPSIQAPQGQHRPSVLTHSRSIAPAMSRGRLPSQLPLALQAPLGSNSPGLPLTAPPYGRDTSIDSVHRGQMLSILTGSASTFWSSAHGTAGAGIRSTGAVHPGAPNIQWR